MADGFKGVKAEMKKFRQGLKDLEKEAAAVVAKDIMAVTISVARQTPLWTGELVVNYRWGRDGQTPTGKVEPGYDTRFHGSTNELALNVENLRPAAMAQLREQTKVAIDPNKLRSYVFTNTVDKDKWDLADAGNIPDHPNQRRRAPWGAFMSLAAQTFRANGRWK